MRRFRIVLLLALIVLISVALGVTVAQWPHFRALLAGAGPGIL
jgi:hypothetical protein